ncbi:MAG: NIL domain-containing protein [Planctomycetota bacterium]
MKKRIFGNFPPHLIKEPILTQALPMMFKVKTNIRGASISDDIALVVADVEGDQADVEKAVEYLRTRGVSVKEMDPNSPISRPPQPGDAQ